MYWMGSQARFTITEPEHARQILSDFKHYQKPYRRPDAQDVIGNGLEWCGLAPTPTHHQSSLSYKIPQGNVYILNSFRYILNHLCTSTYCSFLSCFIFVTSCQIPHGNVVFLLSLHIEKCLYILQILYHGSYFLSLKRNVAGNRDWDLSLPHINQINKSSTTIDQEKGKVFIIGLVYYEKQQRDLFDCLYRQ